MFVVDEYQSDTLNVLVLLEIANGFYYNYLSKAVTAKVGYVIK